MRWMAVPVLALSLAACGGGDGDGDNAAIGTVATTEAETTVPETAPSTEADQTSTTTIASPGGVGGAADTTAPPATTMAPTTAAPTTAAPEPTSPPDTSSSDCLVGNWVITQDEMNGFYDALEATVGAPLDISVVGQTLLDFTADTYRYTANFDLTVEAAGTSGQGQSTGTVSGTYVADDGIIVTELGSSSLSVIVTVAGVTMDESDFANGLLGSVPINDAPYSCAGANPVVMFETADPSVRHPVTLTPA